MRQMTQFQECATACGHNANSRIQCMPHTNHNNLLPLRTAHFSLTYTVSICCGVKVGTTSLG
jgi:hypothetical protein